MHMIRIEQVLHCLLFTLFWIIINETGDAAPLDYCPSKCSCEHAADNTTSSVVRWVCNDYNMTDFQRLQTVPPNVAHIKVYCSDGPGKFNLTETLFSDGGSSVKNLTFYRCPFHNIQPGAFERLNNLEILVLDGFSDHDDITRSLSVKDGAFDGLIRLRSLSITFQKLKAFPFRLICQLEKLEVLNISHNDIGRIFHGRDWRNLKHFLPLPAKSNYLDEKCANKQNYSLRVLDTSHNPMFDVLKFYVMLLSPCRPGYYGSTCSAEFTFTYNSSLRTVNDAEKISMANSNLSYIPPQFFRYLTKLRYLDLRGNQLEDLHFMAELYSLEYLDVSNNNLDTIQKFVTVPGYKARSEPQFSEIAHNASHLKHLNMSGNSISELDPTTLCDLHDLQSVDISHNFLHIIHDTDPSCTLASLRDLYISGNYLDIIPSFGWCPFLTTTFRRLLGTLFRTRYFSKFYA